jgi:hypothetical protein
LLKAGKGWERISGCGAVGETPIANAIAGAAAETDSIYLGRLWYSGMQLRSASIFNSSRALVGNTSATVPSRVMALAVMLAQVERASSIPTQRSFQDLVTVPSGSWCWPRMRLDDYSSVVSVPTTNDIKDAAAVLEVVLTDASTPAVLRDFARCGRVALLPVAPRLVDPDLLVLAYVCGTRFRIENNGPYDAQLIFSVVGTSERRTLNVNRNSAVTYQSRAVGTVELLYNGQVVRQTPNRGIACT